MVVVMQAPAPVKGSGEA